MEYLKQRISRGIFGPIITDNRMPHPRNLLFICTSRADPSRGHLFFLQNLLVEEYLAAKYSLSLTNFVATQRSSLLNNVRIAACLIMVNTSSLLLYILPTKATRGVDQNKRTQHACLRAPSQQPCNCNQSSSTEIP